MQGNLTREVMITHYPAILKMLKDTIPPFYAEAKTALSKQLSETINTLNRYNLNEPFIDFYNFFHDCVEGLGDVKTYLNKVASNAELNEKVKVAFEELNQAINSTFGEAIEKFNDEPCQTRIIRNMGAFTDEVDANITDWINFVTKAFGEDSANERNHMKKIYESFQLNVTQCTVKPLATSKPCLLSLVRVMMAMISFIHNYFFTLAERKRTQRCCLLGKSWNFHL